MTRTQLRIVQWAAIVAGAAVLYGLARSAGWVGVAGGMIVAGLALLWAACDVARDTERRTP